MKARPRPPSKRVLKLFVRGVIEQIIAPSKSGFAYEGPAIRNAEPCVRENPFRAVVCWQRPCPNAISDSPRRQRLDLQTFLCKCPTGSSFKIAFELPGLLLVRECDGCFNAPRTVFGRVRNFARIVSSQPVPQIIGYAGIKAVKKFLTLEDVNVEETHSDFSIF